MLLTWSTTKNALWSCITKQEIWIEENKAFLSITLDHAHEQMNKMVKGEGGAIGLTEMQQRLNVG